MAAERDDPAFLEVYGAWVRSRPRTAEYDAHVRRTVPIIADVVGSEIARDGHRGVCVDASMMLTKMLEEEGVWCYGAKGALTILAPTLPDPTHFWMFDETPVAGHVWVVAPPFEIVDVTLKTQPYERGEAALVPASVVTEDAERIVPAAEEYVAASILRRESARRGRLPIDVHLQLSADLARAAKVFPLGKCGSARRRYATRRVA